jgi:glycine/D-amino acid oxidase-like deaminating enzyme/nitrite reductase/ring-hydroxylating ferredoxin subunit
MAREMHLLALESTHFVAVRDRTALQESAAMRHAVVTATDPVWMDDIELTTAPPLLSDTSADVCIVGAGIAGITTAYLLAKAGKQVVLLDDGPIGGGQTCLTSAHLASEIDDRYVEIARIHGEEGAKLAADSHSAAIDCIERIVQQEGLECDFRRVDGYLFAGEGQSTDLLDDEYDIVHRMGIIPVERMGRAPIVAFDTGPALRFGRQAQFQPLKYLSQLARAVRHAGGRIYGSTHAEKIEGGANASVSTSAGPVVRANHIVVATNTPINDLIAIHTKQAPYMTYVIGCEIPAGSVTRALYWDTLDPYHYVRVHQHADSDGAHVRDVLIVGGEDHKTGQASDGDERFANLEEWARERFVDVGRIDHRWSGQVMETIDGLAFIGRNPMDKDNVFIATGDSGMGLTHGTISGLLLKELILGHDHPWAKLYDPSRKPVGALGTFAKEAINVMAEYTAWITPGECSHEDEIAPGSGAIVRHGTSKYAVYRDDEGRLTRCSAVCPHLKCIVSWNAVESTWDCPCHGSRFDKLGRVQNGPANSDLQRVHDVEPME